jgi:hypothetical protein
LETRTGSFVFPAGTGERLATQSFLFTRRIASTHVALAGYRAEYPGDDHHVKRLTVLLTSRFASTPDGWEAFVDARFELRDKNADDLFQGSIEFVLFVETEGALQPTIDPRRT